MNGRNFQQLAENKYAEDKSVCVGLDSRFEEIPESVRKNGGERKLGVTETFVAFNKAIVKATKDLVFAYKLNLAFYLEQGAEGIAGLEQTVSYIKSAAPDVPVIFDAKFADVDHTNASYARFVFERLGADAVTLNPYFGGTALQSFLEYKDKGIFIICRTSNQGAGEFQNLRTNGGGEPLWSFVARCVRVRKAWNTNGNCGLVIGGTRPEELRRARKIVGDMPILNPGIGVQGGDIEKNVKAGKDSRGKGIIFSSSREIIFASNSPDAATAARRETLKLHTLIKQYSQ